jgi:Tfp pilus assembly PilM family ATPase
VYEERPLPEGTIYEGVLHDDNAVVSVLQGLAQKHKIARALVTLPEEFAYIFPVHVHGVTPEEMRVEVEFAMSEHVPIPLEAVVYTFETVGTDLVSVIAYDARESSKYEEVVKRGACIIHQLG